MENKPKISIIIPVYDVVKYIHKCIKSVLKQTYTNLEIILVDDESPDQCGKIAEEYAVIDSRIQVIHKKNGGLSDARNAGLSIATGEFIYFLDSDDYIENDLIEKAYGIYESQDVDLVCFNYVRLNEATGEVHKTHFPNQCYERKNSGENLILSVYLEEKIEFCVWNKLYKTDIIKKNNIHFENNYEVFSEDISFNLYYILYCNKIVMLEECLHYYLIRESSIMGKSKNEPRLNQYIQISILYEKYMKENATGNRMLLFQDIVFMKLMSIQLGKVGVLERTKWIADIREREYYLSKNDSSIKGVSRWIQAYEGLNGIKKWMIAIEFYYGTKKNVWILILKKFAIFYRNHK